MKQHWKTAVQIGVGIVLLAGFFLRTTLLHQQHHPMSYGRSDFVVFYATAKVLARGGNPYNALNYETPQTTKK